MNEIYISLRTLLVCMSLGGICLICIYQNIKAYCLIVLQIQSFINQKSVRKNERTKGTLSRQIISVSSREW